MLDGLTQYQLEIALQYFAANAWLESANSILLGMGIVLLNAIAWTANLVALPGNWIMVLLLTCFVWFGPKEGRIAIGIGPLIAAIAIAILGELVEFAASALGAKRAGASRRSITYAVLGSFVGAFAGAVVGIPIPIVGPIIAAILFAGLGAMAGAIYGERYEGKEWKETWEIGQAAFWGRTFGTFGKISAGFAIVTLTAISVIL